MMGLSLFQFLGDWLILSIGCGVVFGKAIAWASRDPESGEIGDEPE